MQPANARFKCAVRPGKRRADDLGAHVRRQQVHLVDIDAVAVASSTWSKRFGGVVERQRNAFAILARAKMVRP